MSFLVGIDEAGRGPLAGPVSVGAVRLRADFNIKLLAGVRDSKKLSPEKRTQWFKKLKQWQKAGLADFHVSLISSTTIDKKGLSHSIRKAIKFCLRKIEANPAASKVLLDGSLYAPKEFKNQKTIIGGDDKEPVISIASIAAKVVRDKLMDRLAKVFPQYGFDIHKGYGTAAHYKEIKKSGMCEIHRRSFLKKILSK